MANIFRWLGREGGSIVRESSVFLRPLIVHFIVGMVLMATSIVIKFSLELAQRQFHILAEGHYRIVDGSLSAFIVIVFAILVVNCLLIFVLKTAGPLLQLYRKTFPAQTPNNAVRKPKKNNHDQEFVASLA